MGQVPSAPSSGVGGSSSSSSSSSSASAAAASSDLAYSDALFLSSPAYRFVSEDGAVEEGCEGGLPDDEFSGTTPGGGGGGREEGKGREEEEEEEGEETDGLHGDNDVMDESEYPDGTSSSFPSGRRVGPFGITPLSPLSGLQNLPRLSEIISSGIGVGFPQRGGGTRPCRGGPDTSPPSTRAGR